MEKLSPLERTACRRAALARRIADEPIDALLVSSVANVYYLTGFTGDSSALVLAPDGAVVVSDGRYTTQLEQECPGIRVHVRPVGQPLPAAIADVVGRLGIHRLGFEASHLTVADFEALKKKRSDVAFVGVAQHVEALRSIKDEDEIAALRASIDMAERAFALLRAGLRVGQTEKEVADALESALRRCGASSASFPPIVAVGPNAALPHARPTDSARIGDADFVLIDWGATGRSYQSDLTRVLVTGKVTPKFETVYQTVLAARERALAAIRPGARARDVDAEARSVIEEAGFGPFFPHGLGHGIGLEIHEAPRFHKEAQETLQPGMIVTVEPGIYLPDWGGVRIEDDVLVTTDGHEVLTRLPRTLGSVVVAGLD